MSLASRATLLAIAAAAAGCGASTSPPPAPRAAAVHLRIDVPAGTFAPGSELTVAIVTSAQLAERDRQRECVVGWDGAKETVQCPPGVTFTRTTPEEFRFPVDGVRGAIELDARTVALGDTFELSVGGQASDGCNHTGASTRVIATEMVAVRDLAFYTTDMACAPRPAP